MARCVAEGLAGVESLSGIPGSIGATPIQNVGAYGQEVAETIIVGARARPRARRGRRAARPPTAASPTARARSSAPRAAGSCSRSPSRSSAASCPAPLAYAELARTLGVQPGEGAPLADVREAVLGAAPRQGHGARPRRPRHGLRRLVLHQPDPRGGRVRGARGARRRARPPAGLPGGRRARQDLRRLADRARRASSAATATRRASRSPPSTRSRSPTAAPARPPSCSRSPARSPAGCASASASRSSRSRRWSASTGPGGGERTSTMPA